MFFRIYRRRKTWLCKCLKGHVSVHPRTFNILKRTKHCGEMDDSNFFVFFRHSERTSV